MRVVLLLLVSLLCGCGKESPSAKVEPGKAEPASVKPKGYRERVADYLAEARSGAKMLETSPTLGNARNQSQRITEMYAGVKDVPSDVDRTGSVADGLKKIQGLFEFGLRFVKIGVEAAEKKDGKSVDQLFRKELPQTANDIRRFADSVEAKLK